jgi:hypothetical protein
LPHVPVSLFHAAHHTCFVHEWGRL